MILYLKSEEWLAKGLVLLLFTYIVIRSITVPITYDEAATFFHYVHVEKVWPGEAHWDANNHVLNSVLTLLSYKVFGNAEWALRLPNVLAGLLYLFYAVKISFRVESRSLRWALLLSLTLSRFVIEFFSLSRGYGLSMGLFMMALYHAYLWSYNHRSIQLVLAMIAMQLAVLANLSLLTTDLLFCSWVILLIILDGAKRSWGSALGVMLGVPTISWFINYAFALKERGLLYYGQGDGFWSVTIQSLANANFVPFEVEAAYALPVFVTVLFGFSVVSELRKGREVRPLLFGYLLFGSVLAAFIMHWLLGVNFPEDRVAIHFLILIPHTIIFALENIPPVVGKRVIQVMTLAALLVFPASFLPSTNVTYSSFWNRDASAELFYDELKKVADESDREPIVCGYRMRLIPYCYYNLRNNGRLSPLQASGYRSNEADYQIAFLGVEADWSDYDTLLHDIPSDLYLMKRKNALRRSTIYQKGFSALEKPSNQEFFEWFNSNVDSLTGQDLLIEVDMDLPVLNEPLVGWLSVSINDSSGSTVFQENIITDWLRSEWKAGDRFHHQIMVPNIPLEAKTMKVFFWNIEKQPLALGDGKLKILRLEEDR